jgi:hypothetical protein
VRFDDLVFRTGRPVSLAVVPITEMVSALLDDGDSMSWIFFEEQDQRANYDKWVNEPPPDPTPRTVPIRH